MKTKTPHLRLALLTLLLPALLPAADPAPAAPPSPAPLPSVENPVLKDTTQPDRLSLLAADGSALIVDKVLTVRPHELRVIQGPAIVALPADKLHLAVRQYYDMALTAEEVAKAAEFQAMDDQIAAQEAAAARQQQKAQTAAENARHAASLARQPAAPALSPEMAAYQQQVQMQVAREQAAAAKAPSAEARAVNAIAEEMRLQRLAAEASEARRQGRAFYVSPADARALGY